MRRFRTLTERWELLEVRQLLAFVRFYSRHYGFPPTLREGSEYMGLSRARVSRLAWWARRRRMLTARERSPRTMRVTPSGRRWLRKHRRSR